MREIHLSDLFIKGTGRLKAEKDWGYYQTGTYEEARLVIYDKSAPFEITGVNDTGQWTVRRIFE
jgi:hypothetical protein